MVGSTTKNLSFFIEPIIVSDHYGLNELDLAIARNLIKDLKNKVIIKYTMCKLGDIGFLISHFI